MSQSVDAWGAAGQDERLVREFQQGSSAAFDELYRLHRARVRSVAGRYLRDERDVEEAVQDTFLKAFHALPRFNGNFRTGAWLARIAVNSAIDISRKNQRRGELVLLADHEPEPAPAVEDIVVGAGPDVERALMRLPILQAQALQLRGVQGASHEDIARQIGGTPSQAKALLHRARLSFKRVWRETGSGAAFFLTAAAVGVALRLSRALVGLGPAASSVGSTSGGPAEAFAGGLVGFLDRTPLF